MTATEQRARAFWQRTELYLKLGHDRFGAAAFIAATAGELAGPALDVGTGKGLMAIALARLGLDVVSVDVSAEDLELAAFLAKKAGVRGRISFLLSDARSLPFSGGHFGCAVMLEVLHHLQDARPVLTEMVRVVRPNGKIIIADFSEEGFGIVSRVHQAEGHQHQRTNVTLDQASAVLESIGFRKAGDAEGYHHQVAWFVRKP